MSIALALLLLAGLVFWVAIHLRKKTGIPWRRVIASDTHAWLPVQQTLFSKRYGLSGRPDYLIEINNIPIPVEVKPSRKAKQPYESDLMQVVAYCLLIEETMNKTPSYGLLCYKQDQFRIAYTPYARNQVLDIMDDMYWTLDQDECSRNHSNPRKCAGCGFVAVCEEALVEEL